MDPELVRADAIANEHSTLLPLGPRRNEPRFPTFQFTVLVLVQICEPLSSQLIYPFIPQLVSELPITGGDKNKVGYYAGLIESIFFATESMTVLFWSRTSDYVGRKPTLLLGSFGLCISMVCFGLSRTFWLLVISRCLCGALNGNIGVSKTLMGELLTTPDHRAKGFAFMPVVWAIGATIGPFFGGNLARPRDRWPTLFSAQFWIDYPYFLPCVVPAALTVMCMVLNVIYLEETNLASKGQRNWRRFLPWLSKEKPVFIVPGTEQTSQSQDPIPISAVLTSPVKMAVVNYGTLCIVDIMLAALRPLFLAQPVAFGGLGLEPAIIGTIMGTYGLACGILQIAFFAKAIRVFGARRVFVVSSFAFLPVFAAFPILNMAARCYGKITPVMWGVLAVQHIFACIADGAFGCAALFVTASAPNKRSLGTTNGLAQTTASIARAIGPALASSLFSLSVEQNIVGGYGVFLLLGIISCALVRLGMGYPTEPWEHEETED
jgi:MFS family permease